MLWLACGGQRTTCWRGSLCSFHHVGIKDLYPLSNLTHPAPSSLYVLSASSSSAEWFEISFLPLWGSLYPFSAVSSETLKLMAGIKCSLDVFLILMILSRCPENHFQTKLLKAACNRRPDYTLFPYVSWVFEGAEETSAGVHGHSKVDGLLKYPGYYPCIRLRKEESTPWPVSFLNRDIPFLLLLGVFSPQCGSSCWLFFVSRFQAVDHGLLSLWTLSREPPSQMYTNQVRSVTM